MTLTAPTKRKPAPHHKKRTGSHQHGPKHFHKTYWPYLPLALIVGLGVVLNVFWSANHGMILGYKTDLSPQNLLTETNTKRTQDSIPALTYNDALGKAAQAKADDMVRRNYWSHKTPTGEEPWSLVRKTGYNYRSVGENLAFGIDASDAALNAWMNSQTHRANVVNTQFKEVGFGMATSDDFVGEGSGVVIVALYATPAAGNISVSASVPATPLNAPDAMQTVPLEAKPVSRLQTITTGAPARISTVIIMLLAAGGLVFISLRHAVAWRRVFVRGEQFFIHHPYLDAGMAAVVVVLVLASRTAGFIQ